MTETGPHNPKRAIAGGLSVLFAGLSVGMVCLWLWSTYSRPAGDYQTYTGLRLAAALGLLFTVGIVALFSALGVVCSLVAGRRRERKLVGRIGLALNLLLAAIPFAFLGYLLLH